jgi:hypothetical protein
VDQAGNRTAAVLPFPEYGHSILEEDINLLQEEG